MGCDFTRSKKATEEAPVPLSATVKTEEKQLHTPRGEPASALSAPDSVKLAELSISLKAIRLETSIPYQMSNEK